MGTTGTLDFSEDPAISPATVMLLLEDFLPFAVEAFTRRRELFDLPGYEPGLRESNLAVILAEVACDPGRVEERFSRSSLVSLSREALERVERASWDAVPPLAWSYVAYSCALLGEELGAELFRELRSRVALWADRLLDYDFPTGLYRDTKAEETCWTCGPLVGAQALLRDDPRAAAWREKANLFYLNSYSREEDLWEQTLVEGKAVRDRAVTANVFPDFTTENHGAFHPTYQTCINNYAIPYILSKKLLGRVPESLTWNWRGLHGVMARLFGGDGRIQYPAGTDYHPSCHCEQAHYLALIADALKDPLALWALKKALANVREFQLVHDGRFVSRYLNGDRHVYWEFHFGSFLAFAHALAPYRGIPVWDDAQALRHASGPWVSPYVGMLVHKGPSLHTTFSLRSMVGRQPGSGFIVPQSSRRWTDYFCALPQLAPTIRSSSGASIALAPAGSIVGSGAAESWILGAWMDAELRIRRTMALLAHDRGVFHVERIMRYGEQVPIFGSDMTVARARREGPEWSSWSVETLNYRVVNEEPLHRPMTIRHEGGERVVDAEALAWEADGDWVLLDDRLGIVRLWGDGVWRFDYRRETEPLKKDHFWKHDAWALNVSRRPPSTPPTGYGLMAAHAVLFFPSSEPSELASIARQGARVRERRGEIDFSCRLPGWVSAHQLGLGHLLSFA